MNCPVFAGESGFAKNAVQPRDRLSSSARSVARSHAGHRTRRVCVNTLLYPAIFRPDASRDALDLHCMPDGRRLHMPTIDGARVGVTDRKRPAGFGPYWGCRRPRMDAFRERGRSLNRNAAACDAGGFIAAGGASVLGRWRVDAGVIARFMAFRPEAGRRLPHESPAVSDRWKLGARSLLTPSSAIPCVAKPPGDGSEWRPRGTEGLHAPLNRLAGRPPVSAEQCRWSESVAAANQSECSLNADAVNPVSRVQRGGSRRQAIQWNDRQSSILV